MKTASPKPDTVPRPSTVCEPRAVPIGAKAAPRLGAFPPDLVLVPQSRNPLCLEPATTEYVLSRPVYQFRIGEYVPEPQVTIIVVTFNNLLFTRLCLESLLLNTDEPAIEILVVDNASIDGTDEYVRELARRNPVVRLCRNASNVGFAAANNIGIQQARGKSIVLLNNDTIATRGWLQPLLRHLDESQIGLVGPSTNRIGNEAEIPTSYRTLEELEQFADEAMRQGRGNTFDIRTAAMFCLAVRRSTLKAIGPLDEQFGLGMFEDDDYSMRVRHAGLRVVCTDACFIHHFGQASIGMLAATGQYGELFHGNRTRWEKKWGRPWQPYQRRMNSAYQNLVARIRHTMEACIPSGSKILVVTKGDEQLVNMPRHCASHFPQYESGGFVGHHPADAEEAVNHLRELSGKGAQYLVFPTPSLWWLDFYEGLSIYLAQNALEIHQDDACRVFQLRNPTDEYSNTFARLSPAIQ